MNNAWQTIQWTLTHTIIIGLSCSLIGLVGANTARADIPDLESTDIPVSSSKQQRTLKLINYLIEKSHYRSVTLDDDFSADVLDAYLERLVRVATCAKRERK